MSFWNNSANEQANEVFNQWDGVSLESNSSTSESSSSMQWEGFGGTFQAQQLTSNQVSGFSIAPADPNSPTIEFTNSEIETNVSFSAGMETSTSIVGSASPLVFTQSVSEQVNTASFSVQANTGLLEMTMDAGSTVSSTTETLEIEMGGQTLSHESLTTLTTFNVSSPLGDFSTSSEQTLEETSTTFAAGGMTLSNQTTTETNVLEMNSAVGGFHFESEQTQSLTELSITGPLNENLQVTTQLETLTESMSFAGPNLTLEMSQSTSLQQSTTTGFGIANFGVEFTQGVSMETGFSIPDLDLNLPSGDSIGLPDMSGFASANIDLNFGFQSESNPVDSFVATTDTTNQFGITMQESMGLGIGFSF